MSHVSGRRAAALDSTRDTVRHDTTQHDTTRRHPSTATRHVSPLIQIIMYFYTTLYIFTKSSFCLKYIFLYLKIKWYYDTINTKTYFYSQKYNKYSI